MRARGFRAWVATQKGLHKDQNQDAYKIARYKGQLIAVVCDGLGSRKHSAEGSRKLCLSVCETLKVFDFKHHDLHFFAPILASIWECQIFPKLPEECLSTLQMAIITDSKIYVGKVGDGMLAILGKQEEILEENKEGTLANHTTPFTRDVTIYWRVLETRDVCGLLLCTDGISEDLQPARRLDFVKDFLKECRRSKDPYKEAQIWLQKWPSLGYSDDKTLIAILKE
ncbi:PP2C family serine/threonine-protein phosphatase [Helicobacter baculiformis]|uniref:PP2C family serine/threonine-protein phosphatase n=1 Tax=Helicobacter baculiformis TaxID=427351 RepID=A0ABV7ZLJ3_9HELI|nr:PP2C family serine/threonine-protein phosphatase [Helicobacter baculiformis]